MKESATSKGKRIPPPDNALDAVTRPPTATLADVARRVGLHRTTVSQILNNRPNCWASEKTRQRVHAAVAELGYRPNLSARALRSGKSRFIGLVMPGFHFNALHNRPVGLTEAAARSGYTVVLSAHPNDASSEDQVIRRLVDRAVDGLVIYPVDQGPHAELKRLVDHGFPVVTFDGDILLDFACDDISADYHAVAAHQVRHLLDIGRRAFCIVKTQPEACVNRVRNAWVRRELKAVGLPPPLAMASRGSHREEIPAPENTFADIQKFIRQQAGTFDAVIAFDAIAALFVRGLQEAGLRVPEDVAVMGAGDTAIAHYNSLPLTSINTRDEESGARAFELLLERIDGHGPPQYRREISPTILEIRQSTQSPPA